LVQFKKTEHRNINPASYACISPDNRVLYYSKGAKIWSARRTTTGWKDPAPLPYPVNGPDENLKDRTPHITGDGGEMVFASQRDGGYGSFDLYVVRWNGTAWDSLTNLGPRVNTAACETHPARSWDGNRLYYSDFGGKSQADKFGDADLYVSYRDASGWGPGRLVGPPVNTDLPCCSAFPTKDGKLYIGSEVSEGGFGEEDIWVVNEKSVEIIRESVTIPGKMGWKNTGELEGAWYVYCLVEAQDGAIYAGTAPNGDVYKTTNGGTTWTKTGDLAGALRVYSLIEAPGGKILAGTSPDSAEIGRIFITTNGGANWRLKTTPPVAKAGVHSFFYSDGVLYCGLRAGGDNILVSSNSGETWRAINLPFPDDEITLTDFLLQDVRRRGCSAWSN
jgi:hypothetical protein